MDKVFPRIPSGCAISGIMNKKGQCIPGTDIIKSIALMHDRSNGLGGDSQLTGFIPSLRIIMPCMCFMTA